MISSTRRAGIDSGIARPMAFAVFRFTAEENCHDQVSGLLISTKIINLRDAAQGYQATP
jgi:hypothetical protein